MKKENKTEIEIKELIRKATRARESAYAPYSGYKVGAALLTSSGNIYTGCNVENAVYPLSICAERTAVFKAVSNGETGFSAVAVVTDNGGTPCGSCRQVLREFGKEILVYVGDLEENYRKYVLDELLPESFSRCDLEPRN